MTLAALTWGGGEWAWFVIFFSGLALLLLGWSYWTGPRGPWRWLCLLLKVLGLASLALCLLEPLGSGQRARPGANVLAVVADDSQSLKLKDRGETRTRGEMLKELLDRKHQHWQSSLDSNFEVRRYTFAERLEPTEDFTDLRFEGRSSALGSALRTVADRCRGRPVAGVLVFTDGNATDMPGAPDLSGLPPIYPVVMGRAEPAKDLAVQQVHATETDFEDSPVVVQASVSALGYRGQTVVGELLDQTGRQVASQSLTAPGDNATLAFRFPFKPEKSGLSFYRFEVRARNETGAHDAAASEEATLANNSAVVAVERGHGPYRILYVAGRPNWEFKFLNRAAQEDEQLQLVGLIRVAKREPKFTFMGRPGESSNPLFRGFGNQSAEEIERYDQPVLVRLNTRDKLELRSGFPRTAEELYPYNAVIVGDLEAAFFTPEQATLLQKFVSERGGGFLMLGGMESFRQGGYQRTPIGDMLPVYLDNAEPPRPPETARLDLTAEGLLQSWARVRDTESAERARLESMVPFQVLNPVREVKPGASVIATLTDTNHQSWPGLVVQKFGRGHTAALTVGDLWRWGLHDSDAHKDMDKFWRQLLRWLVNDVPNRVELTLQPHGSVDQNAGGSAGFSLQQQPSVASGSGAMRLQVRARDAKFEPLDDANVTVEVQPVLSEPAEGASTNSIRLHPEPGGTEPGVYEAAYVPRATGGYRASVWVTNSAGADVGQAAAGWSTDLAGEEFRSLSPNLSLLQTLAQRTGGQVIPLNELKSFVNQLPYRHAPIMEPWIRPLWHTPAMFGFALLCFLAEWGLRRLKGMP
jgi:uncharacterized membrane protein